MRTATGKDPDGPQRNRLTPSMKGSLEGSLFFCGGVDQTSSQSRQEDVERLPRAVLRLEIDPAAQVLHEHLGDAQPEAGPPSRPRARRIRLSERGKDARAEILGDAGPVVPHRQAGVAVLARQGDLHDAL